MDPLLLRVWLGALALVVCLLPMALYLLFISWLNNRRRVVVISGSWDFALLLLGEAGFIITGASMMLSMLTDAWMMFWQRGNLGRLKIAWEGQGQQWVLVWLGFMTALGTLAVLLIRYRRGTTVLYNATGEQVRMLVPILAEKLGYRAEQAGTLWHLRADPALGKVDGSGYLEIDAFHAFRNVSLHWLDTSEVLRQEMESALVRELQRRDPGLNPIAGWLMTAGILCFVVIFAAMALMLLWLFGR